jgi:predicted nucleotide-binding protein (sugar kinase/HSP70/actin superfamily)
VLRNQNGKVRIGIPRALLYYKYSDMWITYFEELGAEVITSPKTTKQIKNDSVRLAPDEDCYSTKLYFGHVLALKEEVDYLFVPRFGGRKKKYVGCPKFIGLAEVLRSMLPDLPEILMPHYNRGMDRSTRIGLIIKAFRLGKAVTRNPFIRIRAIIRSYKANKMAKKSLVIDEETLEKWENSEIILNDFPMYRENERPLKVALVGHSYVLNDPYASLSIRQLLQSYGVDIITSEQIPRNLIENQMAKLQYDIYFDFEREILGTIMHFIESKTVDGIIHLLIFCCGPDSIAGEIAARFSKREPDVPLLQLVFDELTGEAGMRTRIEAFVDMLRRSIEKQTVFLTAKVRM